MEKYAFGDVDCFKHLDSRLDDKKIIKLKRNNTFKKVRRKKEGYSREKCGRKIEKKEIKRL